MCGIFCFISKTNSLKAAEIVLERCRCLLGNRGPNASNRELFDSSVLLFSSVLWQQGSQVCPQPVQNDRFILIFNGDMFLERDSLDASDTEWLLKKITAASNQESLLSIFKDLKGPFSLILLDKQLKRVYFGRDSIGRNSLLLGFSDDGIVISSVLEKGLPLDIILELPPDGIYYVNLPDEFSQNREVCLHPWNSSSTVESAGSFYVLEKSLIELLWMGNSEYKVNFNYHTSLKDISIEKENVFDYLLNNDPISNLCSKLISILSQSVRERIINTPKHCKQCIVSSSLCNHPKVGILFSGGIDCTIIALLADQFVAENDPIDLLNVAFEKIVRPVKTRNNNNSSINWDVPDRVTGRKTLIELRKLRPYRQWNFVEINVTREELKSQSHRIAKLVFPLKSVLDESLGTALWFAARAKGTINDDAYQSPCRVMLLGSGADELFGGYSRHRAAFYRNLDENSSQFSEEQIEQAYSNLANELDLDWKRLPSRNLARDDRVICDHGVTPRTPYLQEDFVATVHGLTASQRCYHPLGAGMGDKLTLRLCGYRLGLIDSAYLKKRALQFGSRIADRKQNANDDSNILKT